MIDSETAWIRLVIVLAVVLSLGSCEPAFPAEVGGDRESSEISQEEGVYSVLGEAGPSYEERLAVAFALQNRGHLGGVYGLKVTRTRSYEASAWQNACRSWNEAKEGIVADVTNGATHWLSDYDLKHCKASLTAFRFRMVETAYIASTHFYKDK